MRLFVAAWLSDEAVAALRRLPRPPVEGVRWTTDSQWHVTLRFLGRVPEGDAGMAGAALASVAADRADAVLGPVSELLSPRVLCVPVAGLDAVAAAVGEAFAGVGEPAEARRFRGHVTLARLRSVGRRDARALAGVPVSARWSVTEIALVRSHLGGGAAGTPARYETLATQPLGQL